MVRTFERPTYRLSSLDLFMLGPVAFTAMLGFACGSLGGLVFCGAVGLL